MPWKKTQQRAASARRRGKSPSTQAGAFVEEQLHKEKRGQGRAKNPKQAIAIGLSQARRAGVKVPRKGATQRKAGRSAGKTGARRAGGAARKRAR